MSLPDHICDDELTALVETLEYQLERDVAALAALGASYRAVCEGMQHFNTDAGTPLEEDPIFGELLDARTKLYEARKALEQVQMYLDNLDEEEPDV